MSNYDKEWMGNYKKYSTEKRSHYFPDCPSDGSWRITIGEVFDSDISAAGTVIVTMDRMVRHPSILEHEQNKNVLRRGDEVWEFEHQVERFLLCRDQATALLAGKQIGLV